MTARSPFEKLLGSLGTVPVTARRMERRLAALLALDVQNYSLLMARDEEDTHQRIGQALEAIVPQISGAQGRIISFAGDGLMVEIPSAVEALKCAISIQADAARRNATLAAERRIAFRIGVNSGDIVVQRGRIGGDAVNIAARLEQLAEPGGICISARVRDDAHGRVDITAEDIGAQTLKNIARPVRVFRVRPEGAPVPPTTQALPLPDKPSIAVLPFDNMSGDPDQEYFADGVAEDIITELSRSRALFVIARNSSFTYRGKSVDIRQVSRELGVRYVLEGSVRRSGERVRITAQLIEAESGNHLWAERYDRTVHDVFAIQDEITQAVATAIGPAVADAEMQRAIQRPGTTLGVWELYQKGRWHHAKFEAAANAQAQKVFEQAVEQDPMFAPAHVHLTIVHLRAGLEFITESRDAALRQASAHAQRAIQIDPGYAEAYGALSAVLIPQGDLANAKAMALRARALNPNCSLAHFSIGRILLATGCPAECRQALAVVERLDPRGSGLLPLRSIVSCSYYSESRYEECVATARHLLSTRPDYAMVYRYLAAALGQLGRAEEARDALDRGIALSPGMFDVWVRNRVPHMEQEHYDHMLDGLRKAGWRG